MTADETTTHGEPLVRRAEDIEYDRVGAADGLSKGVLLNDSHGTPNVALRRFTLAAGGSVPEHTNEIEHEQYVLNGEYVVGIGETEQTVYPGDAIHIPAGVVHWYRNDSDEDAAFICAVPTGDDEIQLLE